ncbi:uncharacterized protein [Argopecten irradians]|uniref:uncharacterized protein n=1 Tax=Argopecten irradians TaxID=31199 RepID=UPI00371544D9
MIADECSKMATTRQREQTPKKPSKGKVTKGTHHTLRTRQSSLKTDEEEASDPSGCMSLNVLAQVASATLQKEPKKKKLRKRSLQTLEMLDLDQIQSLSDKALLSFFSEMKSNEITRNFTYTCYLMPKKCQEQYKSFGNETQARMRMRSHLQKHIEKLVEEFNDPSAKGKLVFQAEPIHVRNKRVSVLASKKKSGVKRTKFTALKPRDGNNSDSEEQISKKTILREALLGKEKSFDLECEEMAEFSDDDEYENIISTPSKRGRLSQKQANIQQPKSAAHQGLRGKSYGKKSEEEESELTEQDETERRMEENEQFIIDLLSRNQPHHDHCYTTIFGKKRGIDDIVLHDASDEETEEDNDDHLRAYKKRIICPEKGVEPILCLGNVSVMDELTGTGTDEASKTIIVCSEEIIDDLLPDDYEGHNGQRPYPPMPKSALAKRGRIAVPEECDPISEEEEPLMLNPKRRKKAIVPSHHVEREVNVEWERKLALKCIRELKLKKKEDRSPLHCRICKDKKFTASATLMYHYRSHAGKLHLSPFVCLICNTTFTRQHSLNYHMLIHNNQSRFTCKDCGRKFRHPSHFKEHLRRHTGETPFVCTDCPQKFKTRNTYKRHLKTRHGKLLTAAGIHVLSIEEFAKIRTKPYRRNASEKRSKILCRNLDARVKSEPVDTGVLQQDRTEEEEDDEDSDDSPADEENTSLQKQPYYVPFTGIAVKT